MLGSPSAEHEALYPRRSKSSSLNKQAHAYSNSSEVSTYFNLTCPDL